MTRSELQQMIRADTDPTTDVDDLAELFAGQATEATDSTLVVNGLGDLFSDHMGGETDDDSIGDDLGFTPRAEEQDDMVYADSRPEARETLALEQIFTSEERQSEIQRAAMEFQQFARGFHAFATECQQRLTLQAPNTFSSAMNHP